jgi:hypothetical protein
MRRSSGGPGCRARTRATRSTTADQPWAAARAADGRSTPVVGDDSAEIAHEALIREWPRLRGWLAEDREALRTFRQLTTAARSWDQTGRHDADLYRGPRLAAALELPGDLSRVERAFLDASKDAQARELTDARRRARRLRVLLAAVAVALVAALIAGSFALVQRGRARHSATIAQAGRLAAQSREVAAKHPDLGLLLALEGDRLNDSVDARGALLGALEQGSRIRAWLQGFDSPLEASAFSPDGKVLATATQKGTTLWDTATWRPTAAAAFVAGRLGLGRLQPRRADAGDRRRKGRVDYGMSRREKGADLTDPGGVVPAEPALRLRRYSPDGRVIAAGRRRRTTHAVGYAAVTRSAADRKPPGTAVRSGSRSVPTRSGSPFPARRERSGSSRSRRAAVSASRLPSGKRMSTRRSSPRTGGR